jgi:hypothetical protein
MVGFCDGRLAPTCRRWEQSDLSGRLPNVALHRPGAVVAPPTAAHLVGAPAGELKR